MPLTSLEDPASIMNVYMLIPKTAHSHICIYIYIYIYIYITTMTNRVNAPIWKIDTQLLYIYIYIYMYVSIDGHTSQCTFSSYSDYHNTYKIHKK